MSDEQRKIKQVIVMRHDLKMRRGKQIAQGAHASMSFLCRRLQNAGSFSLDEFPEDQQLWLRGSFAKIYCRARIIWGHSVFVEFDFGFDILLTVGSGFSEFGDDSVGSC